MSPDGFDMAPRVAYSDFVVIELLSYLEIILMFLVKNFIYNKSIRYNKWIYWYNNCSTRDDIYISFST